MAPGKLKIIPATGSARVVIQKPQDEKCSIIKNGTKRERRQLIKDRLGYIWMNNDCKRKASYRDAIRDQLPDSHLILNSGQPSDKFQIRKHLMALVDKNFFSLPPYYNHNHSSIS